MRIHHLIQMENVFKECALYLHTYSVVLKDNFSFCTGGKRIRSRSKKNCPRKRHFVPIVAALGLPCFCHWLCCSPGPCLTLQNYLNFFPLIFSPQPAIQVLFLLPRLSVPSSLFPMPSYLFTYSLYTWAFWHKSLKWLPSSKTCCQLQLDLSKTNVFHLCFPCHHLTQ